MPAGTTLTPGGGPLRLTWLRRFPKRKVQLIALLCRFGIRQHTFALCHLFFVVHRGWLQLGISVAGVCVILDHVKIDTSIAFVSKPFSDDILDKSDDFGDVLTDACNSIGQLHVETSAVFEEHRLVLHGYLTEVDILLESLANDLVVDVGDVLDELDIVAEVVGHNPAQNVEADVGSGVSHMRLIIYGRSALVPSHLLRIRWHKLILNLFVKVYQGCLQSIW